MPFLFVDYDSGSGGEKFCLGLSQSPQCEPLEFAVYSNGRTKVQDIFGQQFLMPKPNVKPIDSHPTLYTIIPTHRKTTVARLVLGEIQTIRIAMPLDQTLRQHIFDLRLKKILCTTEPTTEYFLGLVRTLAEEAVNPREFLKQVKSSMTNIELITLSQGHELTQTNIQNELDRLARFLEEPTVDYDLIIPYEDLVYNQDRVKESLYNKFGIKIITDFLNDYAIN